MMAVDDIRPVYYHTTMVGIKEELPSSDSGSKTTIHSGHFMVSRVHDNNNEDDEEEVTSPFNDDTKGFDFFPPNRETYATYSFSNANNQSVSIDASLTKLFECMTLAYSGKITSPKWKQFRGLHLSQKQRIRLNNLIWREWYQQYIYGKRPMVCQFATPLSDHIHSKPEAVVLEGKYWKRQLDAVTAEYKKWRRYFKEQIRNQQSINFQENRSLSEWELLERLKDVTFISHSAGSYMSSTDLNLLQSDITDMDFTNELFASLNQPFAFPNPRELSQLSCADLIQPGLIQLQPNLEEFMDIDSMQEFFNMRMPSSFSSTFMPDFSSASEASLASQQNSEMSLETFLRSSSIILSNNNSSPAESTTSSTSSVLGNNNTATYQPERHAEVSQNITLHVTSDGQYHIDPTAILLGATLSQGSQQTFTILPTGLYSHVPSLTTTPANESHKHLMTSTATSSSDFLSQLLEHQQIPLEVMLAQKKHTSQQLTIPIQPAPSLHLQRQQVFQPSLGQQSPHLTSFQQQPQTITKQKSAQLNFDIANKAAKNYGLNKNSGHTMSYGLQKEKAQDSNKKKDGPFTVPMAKPVIAPRKPTAIVPAQSSSSSQQSTAVLPSPSTQASYLAELLKNGTYPGALINVKKESTFPAVSSSPIKTTTNFYQHMSPSYNPAFSHNMPGSNAVAMTTASSNHINHSVMSSASTTRQDGATDLDSLSLSNSRVSFDPTISVVKESPTRYAHGTEAKQSHGDNSLLVQRTLSPVLSMDMGSFMDPVSPFSPAMQLSPSSPAFEGGPDSPESGELFPIENRRSSHLSAEQKRRCNLKTGFDLLQQLVPSLSQNPKVSKAIMLQKTAEYCKKLKAERMHMQKESAILKQEIDSLNSAISIVQSQLPETGVPVTRQRKDQMEEMFDEYVRVRTTENSKFWIFSVLMRTLFDSYCNSVSTSSMEELCRTALTWLDQSCSLVTLRPNVLNALRKLSTSTPILTEPQKMRQHALHAVTKKGKGQRGNNMMTK